MNDTDKYILDAIKTWVWSGFYAPDKVHEMIVEAHKDEFKDYDTSKGTIRFQTDNPLPATLLRKLVKARIAENGS